MKWLYGALIWLALLCAFVPFWSRFCHAMKRKEDDLWRENP